VKPRILVVEDDMIIAANLTLQLTKLDYEITGIEARGEEAVAHAFLNRPDIILMDIHLKGTMDGVETARAIQKQSDVPIVYLTANTDEATFLRAKDTQPYAFVQKPFDFLQLQRTLALVVEQRKGKTIDSKQAPIEILNDRIFVRHNGQMNKLLLSDIQYIEAERNYCTIVTSNNRSLLTATLKVMEEKLPTNLFVRVHRSFIVNITKLDVVSDKHVEIGRKVIPLGRSHKEFLLLRLKMV
ncbi:MAG: response regulator, partial [Maribacter sp.]